MPFRRRPSTCVACRCVLVEVKVRTFQEPSAAVGVQAASKSASSGSTDVTSTRSSLRSRSAAFCAWVCLACWCRKTPKPKAALDTTTTSIKAPTISLTPVSSWRTLTGWGGSHPCMRETTEGPSGLLRTKSPLGVGVKPEAGSKEHDRMPVAIEVPGLDAFAPEVPDGRVLVLEGDLHPAKAHLARRIGTSAAAAKRPVALLTTRGGE